MDRLITLEPSSEVAIRIEPGQRCSGNLTLRNAMYTMPVAFRLQPMNRTRYSVRPQSGIIAPLAVLTVEITYILPLNSSLPESFPGSTDSFLLDSVVVPGAAYKNSTSSYGSIPNDWFTARKKQVFIDNSLKVFFVGSVVLARLVAEGLMDQVREVLERSDPEWRLSDSTDLSGRSLLHLAISGRRADLVQLLLEFNPDIDAPSLGGRSPVEEASALGEALIVGLLLAHGASTEKPTGSSWGALHFAAAGGHLEVMRLLLSKGADVNALTTDGLTALHLAAEEHRRDCSRLLLAGGARTNIRGGTDGDTPLHVAASSGDEYIVKLLLTKGYAGLKETRNLSGRTPYDAAAESGHRRLFGILRFSDGLALAASKGEAGTVGRMIERGASVNGRDQNGWTALMRAGLKGRVDVMKGLMEKGAEIDARDEEGYTALHCAAEAGQAEAVELLVKRGAEIEARTKKNATAIQIARSLGYVGIERILAQGGAVRDGAAAAGGETKTAAVVSTKKQPVVITKGKKGGQKKGSRMSYGSSGGGGGGGRGLGGFNRAAMAVAVASY